MPNEGPIRRRIRRGVNYRILAVAVHDLVMSAIACTIVVWLAYYNYGNPEPLFFLWPDTLLFTAICGIVFWSMGLYRGMWHYASFNDLVAIVKAVLLALLVFVPLLFVATRLTLFPRSGLILLGPLEVVLLAGPRLLYRALKDGDLGAVFDRRAAARVPVLLIGAGIAAETFIREMTRQRDAAYRVVGLLDDKPNRQGRDMHGIRVQGRIADLAAVVARLERRGLKPQRLIITGWQIEGATVRALLDEAERLGLTLARLPRLTDFKQQHLGQRLEIRPVDVEDLLGRPQKVLDRDSMAALIRHRRVLVTGAGGTIGSELARQISALGPAALALFDSGEYNLYRIDRELAEIQAGTEGHAGVPREAILGDVRDPARLAQVFASFRPELVFHAAALKHLPLVEDNPAEGILTNVVGTRHVADACRRAGVAAMVLISTDKAVNPTSVMGASKRIAELYCQALGRQMAGAKAGAGPRYVTVRFGNVLGSTGSVVPLFQHQLARGGPLTVTHPDVTRYFMTTREAVELTLEASALAPEAGAGEGKIFVLDMGEPVRIRDLAQQMIRLAGLVPGKDIAITYIGLKPGEKLNEELLHESEHLVPTAQEGILLAAPRAIDYRLLVPLLDELEAAAAARRDDEIRALIARLVPEYAAPSLPIAESGA